MSTHPAVRCAACVLVLLLCGACLTVKRQYPEKRYYMLAAQRPESVAAPSPGPVLRVQRFRASPAYAGKGFVYRTGETTYKTDFYNEFICPPALLVTESTRNWFASAGVFSAVTDAASLLDAEYVLEGSLVVLHGDYTAPDAPKAVLKLDLTLLDDSTGTPRIAARRLVEVGEPFEERTPEALTAAWNAALSKALAEFEQSVRAALAAPRRPPVKKPGG